MGYTHNWQIKEVSRLKFYEAKALFEKCLPYLPKTMTLNFYKTGKKRMGFKLRGWDGFGEPLISNTHIAFNGDGNNGLDCESFSLSVDNTRSSFCKTSRLPYDIAVCVCLLCFKQVYGDMFVLDSDGVMEGKDAEKNWKKAYSILNKVA